MKIAVVSEHASPLAVLGGAEAGGQNVHVGALAGALGAAGHRVVVHTRRDDPALAPLVPFGPGVVVDHVNAGPPEHLPRDELFQHMDRFADELHQRWLVERPDVVHAHFWMSGYAAVRAARRLGVPVLQTFHALGVVKRRHQGDADTSPPERACVEANLVETVDHVIATCRDEVRELCALGADHEAISVVPSGVDLGLFRPGPGEPRPPAASRLVVVSRLVERKGIGDVIEALAGLPGVELVVAGGPAQADLGGDLEAARLRHVAESAGVADRVVLRGRVERPAVPPLLRSADAVVCTPWYEPFGIVPLEAMACGVPLIGSAVGGLLDTIVDGVTGLHVAPRRPDELAAAAQHLLADPALRRTMGRAGIVRARRYGWDRVAATTAAVFRQVLGGARTGHPTAVAARSMS